MARADGTTIYNHLRRMLCADALAGAPDEELLEQFIARRDEAAFAALLRRPGPMVWGRGRRAGGSRGGGVGGRRGGGAAGGGGPACGAGGAPPGPRGGPPSGPPRPRRRGGPPLPAARPGGPPAATRRPGFPPPCPYWC